MSLAVSYRASHYNDLLHQHDASRVMWQREDEIAPLLQLIEQFGLSEAASVCLLHRHMLLEDEERLVYSRVSDKDNLTYATPRVVSDPTTVTPTILQVQSTTCSDSSSEAADVSVKQLEFAEHGKRADVPHRASLVLSNSTFLKAFAALTAKLNVQQLFGLAIRTDELLDIGADQLVMEESNAHTDQERVLKLYPMHKAGMESNKGATQWSLDGQEKRCIRYCGVVHGVYC